MCGKSPHADTSDSNNCILRGSGDHVSTFFKCPVRIEQQNIKKCMTIENLSYKEYQIKYGNQNRFDILSNKEYENHFPDTLNANSNKNNRNKQNSKHSIHKHKIKNRQTSTKQPCLRNKMFGKQ